MATNPIQDLIHRIRSYAVVQGWSAEKYAKAVNSRRRSDFDPELRPSTARDVLKDRGNPTAATLAAMLSVIPTDFQAPRRSASRRVKQMAAE